MTGFNLEDIAKEAFCSSKIVGNCPKCGSSNTHDCEAEGHTCPTAQRIDDIAVGHCDNCDYIWCLECGSEIPSGKLRCGHWAICGECPNETIDIEERKCSYDFETSNSST